MKTQILDCRAGDHPYLHKDFHGALCYAIHYLNTRHGRQAMYEYLRQTGKTVYAPLIAEIKKHGLPALKAHWQKIFALEGGETEIIDTAAGFDLFVKQCPAIDHLKHTGQLYTPLYCESTKMINETICQQSGFACSCDYIPGAGTCVQRFFTREDPAQ